MIGGGGREARNGQLSDITKQGVKLVLRIVYSIVKVYSLLLARGYSVDFTQYPWS